MANITFALDIYLPITSHDPSRDEYQISLLKLILDKSGEDYEIHQSSIMYTQSRVIHSL